MIYFLSATPGSGKSLWAVDSLLNLSRTNKKNLNHNYFLAKATFDKIKELKLDSYLHSVYVSSGQGLEKTKELVFLSSDYFDFLFVQYSVNVINDPNTDDLVINYPSYYFERIVLLNNIIDLINDEYKLKLQHFLPVRPIYTNISDISLSQVRSLPDNCDWRETPQGSYFVIDECQLIDIFSEDWKGNVHPIVKDLTIHRHKGYDFLFITQDPSFVNKYIRKLASHHRHLVNVFGWEMSMMIEWSTVQDSPNTPKAFLRSENITKWSFPKHVYKLYKSTTINTRKKRYPKKLIFFIALAVIFGSMAIYSALTKEHSPLINTFIGKSPDVQKNQQSYNKPDSVNNADSSPSTDQQLEQTKAENEKNVDAASDPLSTSTNSDLDASSVAPQYNPSDPFAYVPPLTPPVLNYRVFSGCAKFKDTYYAFDQQGTIIKDFDVSNCKRMLKHSYDRPFDYFNQRNIPPVQSLSDDDDSKNKSVIPEPDRPDQFINVVQRPYVPNT